MLVLSHLLTILKKKNPKMHEVMILIYYCPSIDTLSLFLFYSFCSDFFSVSFHLSFSPLFIFLPSYVFLSYFTCQSVHDIEHYCAGWIQMEPLTLISVLGNLNKMENLALDDCSILLTHLLHECLYHVKNN